MSDDFIDPSERGLKTRAEFIATLDRYEALAVAPEDAELVFEIMSLKQRLGLPVSKPCAPPN